MSISLNRVAAELESASEAKSQRFRSGSLRTKNGFPIFRKYFQNLGRRGYPRARVLLTKSLLTYDLRS